MKTREELATQIEELATTIKVAHDKSVAAVRGFQSAHRQELEDKIKGSPYLKDRVDELIGYVYRRHPYPSHIPIIVGFCKKQAKKQTMCVNEDSSCAV